MRLCPLCDLLPVEVLYDNKQAVLEQVDLSYRVCYCKHCDFVYADGQLANNADLLTSYYKTYSKYDLPTSRNELSRLDIERAQLGAEFVANKIQPKGKILDVGASVGLFLNEIRKKTGLPVFGIDPSPKSGEISAQLFNIEVMNGTAESFEGYHEFELICLMAVLEHLISPREIVQKIADQMKVGAQLLIEIPSGDDFKDYQQNEPYGEFSIEHINYFGIASLSRLLAITGLVLVDYFQTKFGNGNYGLFACFRKSKKRQTLLNDPCLKKSIETYLKNSSQQYQLVKEKIQQIDAEIINVYGAGSHTARLLEQSGLKSERVGYLFDRNPNLHGKHMNQIEIVNVNSEIIKKERMRPVLISSYHSQENIYNGLKDHFESIYTLYAKK